MRLVALARDIGGVTMVSLFNAKFSKKVRWCYPTKATA